MQYNNHFYSTNPIIVLCVCQFGIVGDRYVLLAYLGNVQFDNIKQLKITLV